MHSDWLEDKFRFDFEANAAWTDFLSNVIDDPKPEIVRIISHILNVHHLWIRRIKDMPVESGGWDTFEPRHFSRLNYQNFQETIDLLSENGEDRIITYINSDNENMEKSMYDILYHILQHNAHHRGQVALLCSKERYENRPEVNYISRSDTKSV